MYFTRIITIIAFGVPICTGSVCAQDSNEDNLRFILDLPLYDKAGLVTPAKLVTKCSSVLTQMATLKKEEISAVLFQRGLAYQVLNQLVEARKDYEDILKSDPKHFNARCFHAWTLASFSDASKELDAVIRENPKSALPLDLKARFFFSRTSRDHQKLPDVHQWASQALKLYALNPDQVLSKGFLAGAFLCRSCISYSMGQYENALTDVNRSLELGVNDQWLAYSIRGNIFRGLKGRRTDALNDFQLAFQVNSESPETNLSLIECMYEMGKKHLACELANNFLQSSRDHCGYRFCQIYVPLLLELKKPRQAQKVMESLLRDRPTEASLYGLASEMYSRLDDFAKALHAVENGLKLKKDDFKLRAVKIELLSGCPEAKYRNGPIAKALALSLINPKQRDLTRRPPEYLLAIAQAECGEFDEALRSLKKSEEFADTRLKGEIPRLQALFQNKTAYRFGKGWTFP